MLGTGKKATLTLSIVLTLLCIVALGYKVAYACSLYAKIINGKLNIVIEDRPNTTHVIGVHAHLVYYNKRTLYITLRNVKIPTDRNSISLHFENVKEVCIYVSLGHAKIGKCLVSSNGYLTVQKSNIPEGTYNLDIVIISRSADKPITIDVYIDAQIRLDSSGKFTLNYYIGNLHVTEIEITCDGITKTLKLVTQNPAPTVKTPASIQPSVSTPTHEYHNVTKKKKVSISTKTRTINPSNINIKYTHTVEQTHKIIKIILHNVVISAQVSTYVIYGGKKVCRINETVLNVKKIELTKLSYRKIREARYEGLIPISKFVYEISVGNMTHVKFSRPITICLPVGRISSSRELKLIRVAYWNTTISKWIVLSTFIREYNGEYYACSNVTHLTLFAVFKLEALLKASIEVSSVRIEIGRQIVYDRLCIECHGYCTDTLYIKYDSTVKKIANGTCLMLEFDSPGTYTMTVCTTINCTKVVVKVPNYLSLCAVNVATGKTTSNYTLILLNPYCRNVTARKIVIAVIAKIGNKTMKANLTLGKLFLFKVPNNVRMVYLYYGNNVLSIGLGVNETLLNIHATPPGAALWLMEIIILASVVVVLSIVTYIVLKYRTSRQAF